MKKIAVVNSKGGVGKSTIVLALADVLSSFKKKVKIKDVDIQGTISASAKFYKPHQKYLGEQNPEYVLYDLPPYRLAEFKDLIKSVDLVIVPAKVGVSDLLAMPQILKDIEGFKNSVLVFNDVRKPHNNTYFKVKEFFNKNLTKLKIADTQLTTLVGYSRIFFEPICGKAKKEITSLIKELNIL